MPKFEAWVSITRKYRVTVNANTPEDVYALLNDGLLPCEIEDAAALAAEQGRSDAIDMEGMYTQVDVSDPDDMEHVPDDAPVAFTVEYESEGA